MYTLSLNDPLLEEKLPNMFREHGTVIITDVFTKKFCAEKMDEIVFSFENLGTGVDRNRLVETWTRDNLPPQTRPGMFQTIMGHIQPVWDIRGHPNVRRIFEVIYSNLRGKPTTDFITSFDGMTVVPNEVGPYHNPNKNDWAHLDQTMRDETFKCVQGQAVLTRTTAAFRCTPGSCHIYGDLLDIEGVDEKDKSDWCKFKKTKEVQAYCEEKKLQWQIPMVAPRGSFIIWSSSTVHSAKYADKKRKPRKRDPWRGWRGVVYVCYRPREELTKRAAKKREKYLVENRLTNHWAERVFAKTPGGRYLYIEPRADEIEHLQQDPEDLYYMLGEPEVDQRLM